MSSRGDAVGHGYSFAAPLYDRVVDPMLAPLRRIGLEMWGQHEGAQVLDVGCGTGSFLQMYIDAGCRVSGIDLSAPMLERAGKTLGASADLRLGDACAMPFEDGSFDLSSIVMALHEMDPDVRVDVLREMARVCKADGRLLLIDFHPGKPRGLVGLYRRAFTFTVERLAGGSHYRNYRRFMRSGGLSSLLAEVGLEVDQERVVGKGNFGLVLAKVAVA